MRNYIATIDNGHEFSEIEYTSDYRNESKGNLQDCKDELERRFGWRRASQLEIIKTSYIGRC